MTAETDIIDALLAVPAFGLPCAERHARLLAALNAAHAWHFNSCPAYRRFCARRGLEDAHSFTEFAQFPYLPVQAFKGNAELLCSVPRSQIKTRLLSSATSGEPSEVLIDHVTARRQVKALAAVLGAVFGPKRRPFLVMDADPRQSGPARLGARSAAVRGFLNFARDARYCLTVDTAGALELDEPALESAMADAQSRLEPVVVFGFTFVLFEHVVAPLLDRGRQFRLPPGSFVAHIGGWKKLREQQVSPAVFSDAVQRLFGVGSERVIDFYGFTEQMGVVYPSDATGSKVCPVFAEVVVRRPSTLEVAPDGEVGLLEFLTPLPHSYPGIAVLTDDLGRVTARDADMGGWNGTRFEVVGRAKEAEVRGCGDILGDKIARPAAPSQHARRQHAPRPAAPSPAAPRPAAPSQQAPRLLFDAQRNFVDGPLDAPVDLERLPVADLPVLAEKLRQGRTQLDAYSVDELIALIAAAARRWTNDPALAPLQTQGLLFLGSWCSGPSLRRMVDAALRGRRGFLDGFQAVGGQSRTMLMAKPRGLVAHWLAGNVPGLAMLTLAQSVLCRNANLLKASSRFSTVLPRLLDAFRGLEIKTPAGRTLRGHHILETLAVVYFAREDRASAEALSTSADVRLAWGGAEAVRTIANLPKRFDTEDIIFGPRLSFMAIGRDALGSTAQAKKLARGAAVDVSVFDQYACASPHTIFVERGGRAASPREFAELLAAQMDLAGRRIPKTLETAAEQSRVRQFRLRKEFEGADLWSSAGAAWTVVYEESADGLATPCYSRVISVRPLDDILVAAEFASPETQTIGLALSGSRRLDFARRAALRGTDRFPEIGRMTNFESPWDGLYPLDRLVKWVTLGGPM